MPKKPHPLNPTYSPLAMFGSELRVLRTRRNLSLEGLSALVGYSGSFIGMVERAEEMPKRDVAVDLDQALDAGESLVRMWDNALKPGPFPEWFDWHFHEALAVLLRTFQLAVIDGLFQTEEYARALLDGGETAVQGRMTRQEILTSDDPPTLVCILDYSVLTREIGGKAVMYEQLQHLVKMASEKVHIHIIRTRHHRGIAGSFVLATMPDRSEVGYVSTAVKGLTLAQPKDLRILNDRFEAIRSKALPEDESLELILRTAEELWT
jgi:transcriptional regulator with XRE-family HTH domain